MDKCFRCGMMDREDSAFVCRANGHKIEDPMNESCDFIIQLDNHCDSQVQDISTQSVKIKELEARLNEAESNLNNYARWCGDNNFYKDYRKKYHNQKESLVCGNCSLGPKRCECD